MALGMKVGSALLCLPHDMLGAVERRAVDDSGNWQNIEVKPEPEPEPIPASDSKWFLYEPQPFSPAAAAPAPTPPGVGGGQAQAPLAADRKWFAHQPRPVAAPANRPNPQWFHGEPQPAAATQKASVANVMNSFADKSWFQNAVQPIAPNAGPKVNDPQQWMDWAENQATAASQEPAIYLNRSPAQTWFKNSPQQTAQISAARRPAPSAQSTGLTPQTATAKATVTTAPRKPAQTQRPATAKSSPLKQASAVAKAAAKQQKVPPKQAPKVKRKPKQTSVRQNTLERLCEECGVESACVSLRLIVCVGR